MIIPVSVIKNMSDKCTFTFSNPSDPLTLQEALERAVNELKYELDQFPIITSNQQHLQQRKELRIRVDNLAAGMKKP